MIEFKKITLATASSSMDIYVRPAETDRYKVTEVTGIGPMPIEVNTTSSTGPGTIYSGSHPADRESVIKFELNPDWKLRETASQLRSRLYSLLSGGGDNSVTVTFSDDYDSVSSVAYVKNIDVIHYARVPEAQITFLHPSPYFHSVRLDQYATVETTKEVDGVTWYEYTAEINNEDCAPSGLKVEASMTSHTDIKFELETAYLGKLGYVGPPQETPMEDVYSIDTIPGEREITSTRKGFLIGYLTPDSTWPMLSSAKDTVVFRSTVEATGVSIFVRKQYWGF